VSGATSKPGSGIVDATTATSTQQLIVSNAGEVTLATLTIPPALRHDVYELVAAGDCLNNSSGAVTMTWRLKLGAVTLLSNVAISMAANANRRQWTVRSELLVIDPAASQWMRGEAILDANSASAFPMGTGTSSGVSSAAGVADLTAGGTYVLTGQLSASDPAADVRFNMAWLKGLRRIT
jgi:hypothetical protein